jgi:hypothetical protein
MIVSGNAGEHLVGGTMQLMVPEIMRMAERILVVSGGILCIYLGYLLFHIAHLKQESRGKLKTELFEFTVAKVGPGVFFALFGAYVLYGSLNHPISTVSNEIPETVVGSVNTKTQSRDAAIGKLTELARKLPTPEDRDAAESALKTLRTNFSGFNTFHSLVFPQSAPNNAIYESWTIAIAPPYANLPRQ